MVGKQNCYDLFTHGVRVFIKLQLIGDKPIKTLNASPHEDKTEKKPKKKRNDVVTKAVIPTERVVDGQDTRSPTTRVIYIHTYKER